MAAATQEDAVDWQAEVIDLKRKGLDSKDIAEAVGKHAATVRKVIARAKEEGTLTEAPTEEQTTVSDFTEGDDRIVWTGENRTEVAKFLGRGENGTIYAQKIDLPSGVEGAFVQARPGDTIIKTAENEYAIESPDRDPLEDFRAEAGEAVGPMPPETPEEPGETEHVLPLMPGTRQMALDFGPNAAPVHQATVKFTSEKWPSGHFGMGDIVRGTFTARIVDVPAKERFDKDSGEYRAKPMAYGAEITEIEYEAVDPGE